MRKPLIYVGGAIGIVSVGHFALANSVLDEERHVDLNVGGYIGTTSSSSGSAISAVSAFTVVTENATGQEIRAFNPILRKVQTKVEFS